MVNMILKSLTLGLLGLPALSLAEDLGAMWGTAEAEAKYYPLIDIPIPPEVPDVRKSSCFT